MPAEFVHLHLHTQYSLLESTVRLEPLFERLKEFQMPAAAITDSGNLFGALPFYQGMLRHGLKPILGCEMPLTPGSRFEKKPGRGEPLFRLVLLAENEEGFRNLIQLSTAGYLQGYHAGVPRIDKELLSRHAKGLIALSGGREGEIPNLLIKGEEPLARRAAGEYAEIFGKDRFHLEIFHHGHPDEGLLLARLAALAKATGAPLIAANNVHYLAPADGEAQDVLLCLGRGETLSGEHPTLGPREYYLKSAVEMRRALGEFPEALARTVEVAERCHVVLELGKLKLPSFPVPEGFESEVAYLRHLCGEGLAARYGKEPPTEALERLEHELSVISKTGFAGYFLIVWDFIGKARRKGIPVGPGRGSAAGSLVAYLLGITEIDPLRYGLLFERFINPERVGAPDIDVDVCDRRRDEVLQDIVNTYGRDRVASIITFGTLAARAVVRDVGRVLGVPPKEVDRIAKMIPFEHRGDLGEALARVPELKALANEPGPLRKLLATAQLLEGLPRHASTHAAGVVVSDGPLVGTVPLCLGAAEEVLTQYDMNALKDAGLIKLDVLGLRTLTVVDDTVTWVRKTKGQVMDLRKIPLDDPKAFRLLRKARTAGLFQLESRGMRDYLRKLAPDRFEDLIALLALYRPGPLGSEMVDDFIRRKKGLVKVEYLHPALEPILSETYGVILYQEQVMRIASDLGGFTLGQADLLRRAMGRKDPEEMETLRDHFKRGAKERGVPPDTAEKLFDLMAKFAGYGFNKSHSAAYALVSYQTAWLKAHHPAEFLAALLTSEIGRQDKVAQYVHEARRLGIPVTPPDVNSGKADFEPDGKGGIRFGLLAVKNVGGPAVESLVAAREKDGPFTSVFDFCRRVDLRVLNARMVESLVQAGAFDSTGARRSQMLAVVDKALRAAQGMQQDQARGQVALFSNLPEEKEKYPDLPELHPSDLLGGEKEVLGFYLSGHPLSEHESELERFSVPLSDLEDLADGAEVCVAGQVLGVSRGKVKRTQEAYARILLEDLHAHADVIVWPEVYRRCAEWLEKDRLVAVKGRLDKAGDRLQVAASEVIPLAEMVERWGKGVRIRVNAVGADEVLVERVKKICEEHRGQAKVILVLETAHHGDVVVEASEGLLVKPDGAFLRKMDRLLGEGAVEVLL